MNLTDKPDTSIARISWRCGTVAALFLGSTLLAGCDGSGQLLPELQHLGAAPAGNETVAAAPENEIKPIAMAPPAVQNTGTAMAAKTMTIRTDLQRLSDALNRRNAEFHQTDAAYDGDMRAYGATVREVETQLKSESTPGNPAAAAQEAQARRQLDRVAQDVAQLNAVASEIASEVAFSTYVEQELKSAATFEASPEDQRQLASLRAAGEADRAVADRLASDVNATLAHRTASLAKERRHLGMVDAAVRTGHAVAPVPVQTASAASGTSAPRHAAAHSPRPLVIIRFDRPNVPYQQVLYTAVKRALERRPNATFDLVAVSPARDDEAQLKTITTRAQHDAEDVLRTLSSMGLPAERVRLSAMMSSEVATNEVQIFVR